MMEEDTSRVISDEKTVKVTLKNNSVQAIETNGIGGSISPNNDNEKGLSSRIATSALIKSAERSGALGAGSNNLTKTTQEAAPIFSPHISGQTSGTKLQNPAHCHPGTNGNNNNNIEKSKLKNSMPGMAIEDSHTTTKGPKDSLGSLESGSTDAKINPRVVHLAVSNIVFSAQTGSQEPFQGVESVKAAGHQLSIDSIPVTVSRSEEEKKLTKLPLGTGHSLPNKNISVGQRLSPSNFQRSLNSQRLSPAHFPQMSTSDMIHSASTLIHGPDIQSMPPQPEVSQHMDQFHTNQTARGTHDSLKKGNSPGPGNLKCQDITSNQLKNYLMSPTQGRYGNQIAQNTNSSSPNVRGVYLPNQLSGTHPLSNLSHQSATSASKPTQKAPRKRKSKAAAKGQSQKLSSFLGDDDDDDNDFIPVGMVQLSSLPRPMDGNPAQQQNQLLKEQLQRHLGQQQQNQEHPPTSNAAQEVPSHVERKDIDSRSQQHQLLLQLVQQVQQQKQILEEQRQQPSPQLSHHQSNTLHNTNVKVQDVQKNQGLIIRHFQQEVVPSGPEGQILSSESQATKPEHRPADNRIASSPHHQQIPTPSLSLSLPSPSSYSYASPLPHNSQTQILTKSVPQSTLQPSIPKITEQLLQRPPSDQQVYSAENKSLSGKDDQRASKVELYLLQSRSEGPQPGPTHPLQSPSPTWQAARSTTPTMASGQHSHQHPEISRMLCSPVSPRQSASSPRTSVSPRHTESPFQPPSSPCQFASPKQPVSPHSRIGSFVSTATSSSASKTVMTVQGPVRNMSNQSGNLKVTCTRQNSSPRPQNSPWQPISPSQVSASNLTNFTGVQKPYPTVGKVSTNDNQEQNPCFQDNSSLLSSSVLVNANPGQSHSSGFESSSHMPQQMQQQDQKQTVGGTVPSSVHYSHLPHSPGLLGTNSLRDVPVQSLSPGQVIHHLPKVQQLSGGPVATHHREVKSPTSSSTLLKVPKPSAQNASPIWQQMQYQHQLPYQESINTSAASQMAETSKAMGLFSSKPVDIQRLSQQHHQQQQSEQIAHQSFRSSNTTLHVEQNWDLRESQICISSQPQSLPASSSNVSSHIAPNTTSHETSLELNNLSEKETRLIQSFFPGSERTHSGQVLENDLQVGNPHQHEMQPKASGQDDQMSSKDVRKNEGALQVLSEIASKCYVQTVESEKLDQEEKQVVRKLDSSSLEEKLADTSSKEDKDLKPGRGITKSKVAEEQLERKLEVTNEAPKREVRQRKPKKPFEQEETPSRRNPRNTQNQKGQTETSCNKKSSTPSSPSCSQRKGQHQGKKSGSVSSKSDTEQEGKANVSSKAPAKSDVEARHEEEADSGLEGDSETESVEPRRLSRRLQVKKEERLRQRSDVKNTDDEGSNQRRSKRIATRIDYKEENSENTSEESGSGRQPQQQHQKLSTTETEDKPLFPGSPSGDSADKVSTRSRNPRRDTSKDHSSTGSTSSSRKETNIQKVSDGLNVDKRTASVISTQSTPAPKSSTVTPKSEPQSSSERKMRTRNRSKSRSRSPLTTASQDLNTPLTRRNMATRQITTAPKSAENEAVNGKGIAPTEFVDELPPRRKNQKKDDKTPETAPEHASEEISKQMQIEDKTNISTNMSEKSGKGKKGKKCPVSKTKPCDTDDKKEADDSLSEILTAETYPSNSKADAERDPTSKIKIFAQDKKEVPSESAYSIKSKDSSLLEKTFTETDEQVPTTMSNNSLNPQTVLEETKFHARGQGQVLSQQFQAQSKASAMNQLSPLSTSHMPSPLGGQSQDVKNKCDPDEAGHSGSGLVQRPRMIMYKLVPVEDENPPGPTGKLLNLIILRGGKKWNSCVHIFFNLEKQIYSQV